MVLAWIKEQKLVGMCMGDEWFSMLDGEGVIYLADLVEGGLKNKRHYLVKKGDTFCISGNTAHQLHAKI
uniref:hypothetical protein n=2 Tax=Yersinia ruckeri TaxID=29486 RepID=UPI00155D971F|nr:hypothetical protein [Yersinia ruckeri]